MLYYRTYGFVCQWLYSIVLIYGVVAHFLTVWKHYTRKYGDSVPPAPNCFFAHYSDVKWAQWRLKSPASRLFVRPYVQEQIKENIKAQGHWPLWGKSTGDRWIPLTKGQ